MKNLSEDMQKLFDSAKTAMQNAYSPYSGRKVGAALITNDGRVFSGCNVENSSYGATICAERVAIQNAVSQCGKIEIREMLVLTDTTPPWPPCGICRQVISEFGYQAKVHMSNLNGEIKTFSFSDLLPNAFTPKHLV